MSLKLAKVTESTDNSMVKEHITYKMVPGRGVWALTIASMFVLWSGGLVLWTSYRNTMTLSTGEAALVLLVGLALLAPVGFWLFKYFKHREYAHDLYHHYRGLWIDDYVRVVSTVTGEKKFNVPRRLPYSQVSPMSLAHLTKTEDGVFVEELVKHTQQSYNAFKKL